MEIYFSYRLNIKDKNIKTNNRINLSITSNKNFLKMFFNK